MTPERREELRRAEDALITARYNLDRKNYLATIAAQEDRIKALESLLVECGEEMLEAYSSCDCRCVTSLKTLASRIDAILPSTPTDN